MVVLACGACDPFLVLTEDPEEAILGDDNKGNDVASMVMSSMEVLANASLMERNKTKSPGLESIPEALTERSDTEEREAGEEGAGKSPETKESTAEPQNAEDAKPPAAEDEPKPVVAVKVAQQENVEAQISLVESKDGVSVAVETRSSAVTVVLQDDARDSSDMTGVAPKVADAEEYLRPPSPPLKVTLSPRTMQTNEQEYDKDPTELYLMLQRKEWQQAVELVEKNAHQAATWVSRKESSGELRWRLLPIHAAVIFSAPESVVEALLKAFPDGAQHKEDQGMLPLHLAFRMGSPESIVSLLLSAFPDSVNVMDRKGRTALELAESTSGPNNAAFIRALKKGPNVAMFGAVSGVQLDDLREENEKKIDELKKEADAKQKALQQEVLTLQNALVRKQENSQVLVDHIASLEAKLAELNDGNSRSLDIKLDSLLSSGMEVGEIEKIYKDEFAFLHARNRYLESKVEDMKHAKEKATDALKEAVKDLETQKAEWNAEKKLNREKMSVLEEDCAGLREHVAVLEEQIKKRSVSEQALTAQMSVLAEQLHSTTSESSSSTEAFSARIRALESERENLRFSVNRLSKKLYFVAGLIDSVSKDQIAIVEQALQNENQAAIAASAQEKMIMDVKEHSELVQDAKNLGDEIKELLTKHAQQMEKTYEARKSVVDVVEEQSRQLSTAEERREEFIKGITGFKNQMLEVLHSVYDELPKEVPEDHNLVDMVLEKMVSFKDEDDEPAPESDDIIDLEEEKKCEE